MTRARARAEAYRVLGLYTNLITSAVGITENTLGALAESGLDHVQISIQDSEPQSADHIAGYMGAFARKRALAGEVVRHKLPLTVNCVMHRANIDRIADMVDLALVLSNDVVAPKRGLEIALRTH
jgi:PqqA peptide cyclase